MKKQIKEKNKNWEKTFIEDVFLSGILYAIQQLVIFARNERDAKFIAEESGYKLDDFLAHQKRQGFATREMNKFFREVFKGSQSKN